MVYCTVHLQSPRAAALPPATECRIYERHPCDLSASCQPLSGGGSHTGSWPATILDISLGGIRLVLSRRFEKGTLLTVEVWENDRRETYTGIARVMHVSAQGNCFWALGCKFFSALTKEELHGLVPSAGPQEVDGVDLTQTMPMSKLRELAGLGHARTVPLPEDSDGVDLTQTMPMAHETRSVDLTQTMPIPRGLHGADPNQTMSLPPDLDGIDPTQTMSMPQLRELAGSGSAPRNRPTPPVAPSRVAPPPPAAAPAPKNTPEPTTVHDILFRVEVQTGEVFDCFIKRLKLAHSWPLSAGHTLSLIAGKTTGLPALKIRVGQCKQEGGGWTVQCRLATAMSPEVLLALQSLKRARGNSCWLSGYFYAEGGFAFFWSAALFRRFGFLLSLTLLPKNRETQRRKSAALQKKGKARRRRYTPARPAGHICLEPAQPICNAH